jgi:hypothetical protein
MLYPDQLPTPTLYATALDLYTALRDLLPYAENEVTALWEVATDHEGEQHAQAALEILDRAHDAIRRAANITA